MLDCKHRTAKDRCRKRKSVCLPGGRNCVLGKNYIYPLRNELKKVKILRADNKA